MRTYDLPKKLVAQAMREADNELHSKHLRGEFDEGDPNHPKYNDGYNYATGKRQVNRKFLLFGYEQDEFLAKIADIEAHEELGKKSTGPQPLRC